MNQGYNLTIKYDGIFGISEGKARLKRKCKEGWDYWVECNGKMKKLTRGNKILIGETLQDAIRNIEQGGEYYNRKVIKIEEIRGKSND